MPDPAGEGAEEMYRRLAEKHKIWLVPGWLYDRVAGVDGQPLVDNTAPVINPKGDLRPRTGRPVGTQNRQDSIRPDRSWGRRLRALGRQSPPVRLAYDRRLRGGAGDMPGPGFGQQVDFEGGVMEAYDRLKQMVADCEEDVRKGHGGNKAAQTRARKAMQDIKTVAQEIREGMLEARNAQPGQS